MGEQTPEDLRYQRRIHNAPIAFPSVGESWRGDVDGLGSCRRRTRRHQAFCNTSKERQHVVTIAYE